MKTIEYYRKLVTSEYKLAPKFNAWVRACIKSGVDLDTAAENIVANFDIDIATANQLDILGAIVGVSRSSDFVPSEVFGQDIVSPTPEEIVEGVPVTIVKTPDPENLASTTTVFKGENPENMRDRQLMTDDIYRLLIKCKIIKNLWKGTTTELYTLWDVFFGETQKLAIHDLQDMSYDIILSGTFTQLERELVIHGYIIPKPSGVRINILTFVSNEGKPLFSYDYNNAEMSGYKSHWVEEA